MPVLNEGPSIEPRLAVLADLRATGAELIVVDGRQPSADQIERACGQQGV